MLEGLYSAAAGMSAQEEQLDAIANNIANASTTGYKAEQVAFNELLHSAVAQAGTDTIVGAGASAEVIGRDQSQGAIQQTGDPLDLAIQGEGFFQVRGQGGQISLTRDGAFQVDAQGRLTTQDGDLVVPPITLPRGVSPTEVVVSANGTVRAGARQLGKIEIVTVPAPDRLLASGNSQFTMTAASGAARGVAGATIRQGALEASNVDTATEMTEMMSAQRDYQLASSAIQTEDQMMSIANQLRSSS